MTRSLMAPNLQRGAALDRRRAIVRELRRHPGRSIPELARDLDLHPTNVRHHLQKLLGMDAIWVDRGSTHRHYAGPRPLTVEQRVALRIAGLDPINRRIVQIILAHERINQKTIIEHMAEYGLSRSTLQTRLRRLGDQGILRRMQGRYIYYEVRT